MPAGNQHPPGRAGVSTAPALAGGARLPTGGVAVAAQGGAVFPDLPQGDG
jgi:hypothetical protein